jgi:hypothetical protein
VKNIFSSVDVYEKKLNENPAMAIAAGFVCRTLS